MAPTAGAQARRHIWVDGRTKAGKGSATERTTKRCCSCKRVLPLTDFHRHHSYPDGRRYECKICISKIAKPKKLEYREKNRELLATKQRDRKRLLKEADPDKWRQDERESRARAKAANPERHRRHQREWKSRNPESVTSQVATRRSRRRGNPGNGWTPDDVREIKRLQRGRCALCRCTLGKHFHRDHIVPLARGGAHDRRNLQLTCAPCNLSKSARDPIEHAQSLGRLL